MRILLCGGLIAAFLIANVFAFTGILALTNVSGDLSVAVAFLLAVAAVCIDAVAGLAIWNRIRRYVAPMIVLALAVGLSGCYKTIAYQLIHEKIPAFYVQFRNDDIEAFTHGFFRDAVRKSIGAAAQKYTQEEVNGGRQADLERDAQATLAAFMEAYGVRIVQLAFTSPPRAPDAVRTAIEQKIAATQRAEQIENEKRQATAEGAKTVALAEAQAKANGLITASINPTLIQWEQMKVLREKWDGHMPMVSGGSGAGLMLNVPVPPGR